MVGTLDDMPHQCSLLANFLFDHQPHVYIVKHDECLSPFPVRLDRLILIHSPRQAVDQETGKGERLTGACLVLCDEAARDGHVHFQQAVHGMGWPGRFEGVDPYTAPGWEVNDMIGSDILYS